MRNPHEYWCVPLYANVAKLLIVRAAIPSRQRVAGSNPAAPTISPHKQGSSTFWRSSLPEGNELHADAVPLDIANLDVHDVRGTQCRLHHGDAHLRTFAQRAQCIVVAFADKHPAATDDLHGAELPAGRVHDDGLIGQFKAFELAAVRLGFHGPFT